MVAMVYDKESGKLVPKGSLPPKINNFGRSAYVISDEMPHAQNMCDGKHYTSKRAFEAEVRGHGCEIIGNEDSVKHTPPKADPTKEIINDVQRAWSELGGDA
jgi:hypothetical protein